MSDSDLTLMIVDDDAPSLRYLRDALEDAGHRNLICADDGQHAWEMLQMRPERIDLLLLDRFMPGIDGLTLLHNIKAQPQLCELPVIMQTAAASDEQKRECLQAGAYYYLTKPYDCERLLTIVSAAIRDLNFTKRMRADITRFKHSMHLLKESHFTVRTLADATYLGGFLANFFPDPDRVVVGLTELLINGVEHGNLGISYTEKGILMRHNRWQQEIERRQKLPENILKQVEVHFTRNDDEATLAIRDQGDRFEWKRYLEMDPERAADPHGRGIAIARTMSFDAMHFNAKGNEVICINQVSSQAERLAV
jgi:CheY-like chemotaxis protein